MTMKSLIYAEVLLRSYLLTHSLTLYLHQQDSCNCFPVILLTTEQTNKHKRPNTKLRWLSIL